MSGFSLDLLLLLFPNEMALPPPKKSLMIVITSRARAKLIYQGNVIYKKVSLCRLGSHCTIYSLSSPSRRRLIGRPLSSIIAKITTAEMGGAFVICQKISYTHCRQSSALAFSFFWQPTKVPPNILAIKLLRGRPIHRPGTARLRRRRNFFRNGLIISP